MKLIRIVTFLACFLLVVPYDLYTPVHHRVFYFGTDTYQARVPFNGTYTFKLINCKVHFQIDDNQG